MKTNNDFESHWAVYVSDINILLQVAQSCGLDRDDVIEVLAIGKSILVEPDSRISVKKYYQIFQLIEDRTNNSDIGLFAGKIAFTNKQNLQIYMTTICETFRDYLNLMPSVLKLSGDVGEVKINYEGELLRLEWHPLLPSTRFDRYLTDLFMVSALTMISTICVLPVNIIKAEFSYKRPDDISLLECYLGKQLSFEQDISCLYIERASLDYLLCQLEYNLSQRFKDYIQLLFTSGHDDIFLRSLRHSVLKLLPKGNLSIVDVAGELNISKRTLQRRLSDKNTCFSQVIQDIRAALSKRYVIDKRLTIVEVAFLLGYSDQSSFSNAFKSWHGCTPGKYRDR
ncbi:MAG: AraC family transcriptional regulator [Alteromonadales bacterium]|nr:AraC family transcriptional regulator [Alteromonadales bacterium]